MVQKNEDELEYFETAQRTWKIDMPRFASLKTVHLSYQTIFH